MDGWMDGWFKISVVQDSLDKVSVILGGQDIDMRLRSHVITRAGPLVA